MTLGLTAPLVAVSGLALKAAIGFEDAFAGVRKTVDATEAQFAELSTGIRNMAKEIPASASAIAGVAEAAGQLGVQRDAILSFTRVMVDLGNTTNLSAQEAADSLARLANITQLPQSQFDRLGSTVVDLGNKLATTEAELVTMGLRIAGAGKQIGLTEAQILGFAGALSSVGIEAEAGGSAISRVFIKIASAVATGGTQLEDFARVAGTSGENFRESFGTDAAGTIITFIEGLNRMATSGENVFGVLEDLGLSEIRVRDALLRAAGAGDLFRQSLEIGSTAWKENTALTNEAQKRYATVASRLQVLRNQLNDVAITIGDALMPTFKQLLERGAAILDFVKDLAANFANLPESTRTLIIGIAGIGAAIGPILFVLGKFVGGIAEIGIASNVLTGGRGLPLLGGLFRGLVSPVGLAVTALVGLGAASEEGRAALADIGRTIADVIKDLAPVVNELLKSLQPVAALLAQLASIILPPLAAVLRGIATALTTVADVAGPLGTVALVVLTKRFLDLRAALIATQAAAGLSGIGAVFGKMGATGQALGTTLASLGRIATSAAIPLAALVGTIAIEGIQNYSRFKDATKGFSAALKDGAIDASKFVNALKTKNFKAASDETQRLAEALGIELPKGLTRGHTAFQILEDALDKARATVRAQADEILTAGEDNVRAAVDYKLAAGDIKGAQDLINSAIAVRGDAARAFKESQIGSIEDVNNAHYRHARVVGETAASVIGDLEAQQKAAEELAEGVRKSFNPLGAALSDLAGKARATGREIIKIFTDQLKAQLEFNQNIATLIARGAPQALIDQLREMGPAGAAAAKQLASSSARVFNEVTSLASRMSRSVEDAIGIFQGFGEAVSQLTGPQREIVIKALMDGASVEEVQRFIAGVQEPKIAEITAKMLKDGRSFSDVMRAIQLLIKYPDDHKAIIKMLHDRVSFGAIEKKIAEVVRKRNIPVTVIVTGISISRQATGRLLAILKGDVAAGAAAEGAIVGRPRVMLVGEGREKEAIIPASVLESIAGAGALKQLKQMGIREYARGGPIRKGELGLVGEKGAELFAPTTSGRILSNKELRTLARSGDSYQITVVSPSPNRVGEDLPRILRLHRFLRGHS
jgi:TP901 family phage tail tape measure protein